MPFLCLLFTSLAWGQTTTISTSGTYSYDNTHTQTIHVNNNVKDVTINLTNVTISSSATAPIWIESGAEVTINVTGTNTITSSSTHYAGIYVAEGSTVTFTGEGTLEVKNDQTKNAYDVSTSSSTAIGGQIQNSTSTAAYSCGTIIFDLAGTINATGGIRSAAIGTCMKMNDRNTKVNGTIKILNGKINATGGYYAAGIGTGPDGAEGGHLNI